MSTDEASPDRFATVLDQAEHVFGGREQAIQWMETPSLHLGRVKPWVVALTPEGEALVRDMLTQLEYGVFL